MIKKNRRKRISSLGLLLIIILMGIAPIKASSIAPYSYEAYTYDPWRDVKESPSMFRHVNVIDQAKMGEIPLGSVDDVHYADGLIYIVDSVEARVNVFDQDYSLLSSIKLMRTADGRIALDENGFQLILSKPEGIFVDERTEELYIADSAAARIFILDSKDFTMKRMLDAPSEMVGVTEFQPSKITVDKAGRIYVVVQSSYEGIVELNQDGSFSRYFGVNSPQVNLLDHFWKSIATDAQKQKMQKLYAPSFNNVTADDEGFIYASTYDGNAIFDIFRLNGRGENVLREEGNTRVMGDVGSLQFTETQFVDVSVTGYGVYAALDRTRGRVFLYDYDGYQLSAFGSLGNVHGQLKTPTGISWMDNHLLVSDRALKKVFVYEPTAFGAAALRGSQAYHEGDWDTANAAFAEALKHNANYDIAYVGIGKNHLMQNEYEDAMYYFKKGNSHDYYSSAFEGHRAVRLQAYFPLIFTIMVVGLLVIFISEILYHKKEGK